MANEMKKIKLVAQKRRARLLAEYQRSGWTVTKLAAKHGVSRARMTQILIQARKENELRLQTL